MATTFKSLVDYPNGSSTLASNITDAAESITLAADPGTAFPSANFWVRIGFEQVLVATRAGAVLTCTGGRGANSTTAAAHNSGTAVTVDLFAAHVTAIQTAINTLETTGAVTALAVTNNATVGGTLDVTGASTLTGAVTVGGGYGSTGVSISATGNIQANGTLTVDGTATLTGAVAAKNITSTCLTNGAGAPSHTFSTISNTATEAGTVSFLRAADAGGGVAGATTDGLTLATIAAAGYHGAGYDSAAAILMQQDGAVSGTNVPGKLVFQTATNAGGLANALVIYNDKKALFVGPVGFNNTAPIAKPEVTGSRGSNAALASLCTALAAIGLITDSTS